MEQPVKLITIVCIASICSMVTIALWPVFLVELGNNWNLTNTDKGLISGAYFVGYVLATPILVGLTDKIDAKKVFLSGCLVGLLGNFGFFLFVNDFWTALISWSLVGAGLAGTYMPGLQILNARLQSNLRVRAVPWYTSCFGIGTGLSFALMGYFLVKYDFRIASLFGMIFSIVSFLMVIFFVSNRKVGNLNSTNIRHPLDLRPAFKKKLTMSYILSYGAHTFELFAFRTWSFALFFFIASKATIKISISTITIIIGLITLSGMVASLVGAKLCLYHKRNMVISLIGLFTVGTAIMAALLLNGPFWISICLLWLYNIGIMLDSGALTAGSVESSDADSRGAILAVHSMFGFFGGALGGPVVGFVLDKSKGEVDFQTWMLALMTMSIGSLIVFFIQVRFWPIRE